MLFIVTVVSAQEEIERNEIATSKFKIGLKGGLSLPSLTDNSTNIYSEKYKSYSSFEAGIFAAYILSNSFSLQLEANYTVKGGVRKGMQPIPVNSLPLGLGALIPDGTTLYGNFENRSELQYLEIPVIIKSNIYNLGDKWKLYTNVGPYVGFLLNATQKTSGSSNIYLDPNGVQSVPGLPAIPFDAETDVKDQLRTVNFGFIGGFEVIRELSAKSELLLDIRGSYGFIPMQKDEAYGKSKIGSVVFSLGYAYKFM